MPAPPASFVRDLRADFEDGFCTDEPDELAEYGRDWTRVHEPAPALVCFPRSTEEVARLLRRCHEAGVAVVPSGGRTGLAGGAVAKDGEIVLSTRRMRRMDPVDVLGRTVRVQAGVVTEEVHQHAEPHGLTWPVDFASKGSSQVGGNIATNAGGVKVIRYGPTRQWVLGLEVVTATGEILELNGALEKNNTGLDLRQLFIGSEGTLGVITEATLKLTRLPGRLDVFLFALPSLDAVLALFEEARRGPFTIMAYETFDARCFARLARHRKVHNPLEASGSYFVLLEVEAPDRGALDGFLEGVVERELVLDGTMAATEAQAAALWTLREGISESLSATGFPHKNDVALPIAGLGPFVRELGAVFSARYPDWEICLFGHIGDGNLHVNVMKPEAMDEATFLAHTHDADRHVFELVRRHAGSVSAEHGVGLLKKEWLSYTRSPAEIAIMRDVKRALDPKGILNPGKVFDVTT